MEDEFERQVVVSVETEGVSDPGENAVNGIKETEDDEDVAKDETSNLESEPSTIREGVKCVGLSLVVLLSTVDSNGAEGERDVVLRDDNFGNGDRGRDRHDRGGNEGLGGDAEGNVATEDRSGDG